MAAKTNQYVPDYTVAPGEVIADCLETGCLTPADLAKRTGLSLDTVEAILRAKIPITAMIAAKLEPALGPPARFWLNLEQQFQEDTARLAKKEGGGR